MISLSHCLRGIPLFLVSIVLFLLLALVSSCKRQQSQLFSKAKELPFKSRDLALLLPLPTEERTRNSMNGLCDGSKDCLITEEQLERIVHIAFLGHYAGHFRPSRLDMHIVHCLEISFWRFVSLSIGVNDSANGLLVRAVAQPILDEKLALQQFGDPLATKAGNMNTPLKTLKEGKTGLFQVRVEAAKELSKIFPDEEVDDATVPKLPLYTSGIDGKLIAEDHAMHLYFEVRAEDTDGLVALLRGLQKQGRDKLADVEFDSLDLHPALSVDSAKTLFKSLRPILNRARLKRIFALTTVVLADGSAWSFSAMELPQNFDELLPSRISGKKRNADVFRPSKQFEPPESLLKWAKDNESFGSHYQIIKQDHSKNYPDDGEVELFKHSQLSAMASVEYDSPESEQKAYMEAFDSKIVTAKVGSYGCISCHGATSYILANGFELNESQTQGKASDGEYPLFDLFNMRHFGYYGNIPSISLVKAYRARQDAKQVNEYLSNL